jgi:hypothetical protein
MIDIVEHGNDGIILNIDRADGIFQNFVHVVEGVSPKTVALFPPM